MLLIFIACNPEPLPPLVEIDNTHEQFPMRLWFFHNENTPDGEELPGEFQLHAWYGAASGATATVTWSPENRLAWTDNADRLRVELAPDDINPDVGGHQWVEYGLSVGNTVWPSQGCAGYLLEVTPNLWVTTYERADRTGRCRVYLNHAQPEGTDEDAYVLFTRPTEEELCLLPKSSATP